MSSVDIPGFGIGGPEGCTFYKVLDSCCQLALQVYTPPNLQETVFNLFYSLYLRKDPSSQSLGFCNIESTPNGHQVGPKWLGNWYTASFLE